MAVPERRGFPETNFCDLTATNDPLFLLINPERQRVGKAALVEQSLRETLRLE